MLVFGRGSNLLVADAGFEGIAVSTAAITDGFDIDAGTGIVRAGASVALPVLARQTAAGGSPDSSGPSACRVRSVARCG